MVISAEKERVKALLTEAVTVLCKNGLPFKKNMCVQGLLGITLDESDVFLIDFKEVVNNQVELLNQRQASRERREPSRQPKTERIYIDDDDSLDATDIKSEIPESPSGQRRQRRRKRRRSRSNSSGSDADKLEDEDSSTVLEDNENSVADDSKADIIARLHPDGGEESGIIVKQELIDSYSYSSSDFPALTASHRQEQIMPDMPGCSQWNLSNSFSTDQSFQTPGQTPTQQLIPGSGTALSRTNQQQRQSTQNNDDGQNDNSQVGENHSTTKGGWFSCYICLETFTQTGSMNRHIRSRHLGVKHQCQRCGKAFHRIDSLKLHNCP